MENSRNQPQDIDKLLDSQQVDYPGETQNWGSLKVEGSLRYMLKGFFAALDLSSQDIEQAIHCLARVYASLPEGKEPYTDITVVFLILLTFDNVLYKQFIAGETSDLDVVDRVFDAPVRKTLQQIDTNTNVCALFEAVLIMYCKSKLPGSRIEKLNTVTPLEQRWKEDTEYAYDVRSFVEKLYKVFLHEGWRGFQESIGRINGASK